MQVASAADSAVTGVSHAWAKRIARQVIAPSRMVRYALLLAVVACVWLAMASPACAADPYPPHPEVRGDGTFPHGPGFYFSLFKIALLLSVFLMWVYSTSWVNDDTKVFKHETEYWNALAFGPTLAAILLVFVIPWFWLSFPLLLAAWAVPIGMYAKMRNEGVNDDQKVFTKAHIRFWLANRMKIFGVKVKAEEKSAEEKVPVKVKAKGGATERDDRANLILAKQVASYIPALELLADAMKERADQVLLDVTAEQVGVRLLIDGLWEESDPYEREIGDEILEVFKRLAALNPEEHRARQESFFEIEKSKSKVKCIVMTQGTKTGERALLRFDDGGRKFDSLVPLGMREKMQEQLLGALKTKKGVVLFTAPPMGGLTTTMNAALTASDRFVKSWIAIEDVAKPEKKIENVQVFTYKAAEGEKPATILDSVIRQYPDCYVVRDLADADSLRILVGERVAGGEGDEGYLVVTSVKAREASEGLLRLATLADAAGQRVPPAEIAPPMLAVLNQRLIRKLCPTCKEGFEPTPQMLQKLGLPADRVPMLYRQHTPDPEDPKDVCAECSNRGFKGRTSIFELLIVNDDVRAAFVKTPNLEAIRVAARKAGMRTLQEEGIILVAKGITSLEELKRILSEGQQA